MSCCIHGCVRICARNSDSSRACLASSMNVCGSVLGTMNRICSCPVDHADEVETLEVVHGAVDFRDLAGL
eukprot:9363933-Pyramimonas_sp.AAC.1